MPWRRAWQPTPVFLPGEPHGERSLAGCSLWGCKESDATEATECTHVHTHGCLACFDMTSPWMLLGLSIVDNAFPAAAVSRGSDPERLFPGPNFKCFSRSQPQILIKRLQYNRPRARPRQENIIIQLSSQITGSNHSLYSVHASKGFTYLIHLILKAQSDVSTVAICLFQRN